jgi:hypothetical protein
MIVDNQLLVDHKYCPLRGHFRHDLDLVGKAKSIALMFGKAFHKGPEEYEKSGKSIEKAIEAFVTDFFPYEGLDKFRTVEKGVELLKAWHGQFGQDGWKCLQSEVKFHIELSENVIYTGRIDQLGEMPEFGLGVKDFKTSKQPWNFVMTPNDQFTGYLLGGQSLLGKECENFWVDIFGIFSSSKDGKRKLKDGRVESVLQRTHLTRTESQLQQFIKNVITWCAMIEEWKRQEFWPTNSENCNGKYGACPYHIICSQPEEMRESIMTEFYIKEHWTPGGPEEGGVSD